MTKIELKDVPQRELIPGYLVQFIHAENMTFAYWDVSKDALLPEHSHVHEQVTHMQTGTFELTVEGKVHVLQPGDLFIIPSNALHSGKALTKCTFMDSFYPTRDDYK